LIKFAEQYEFPLLTQEVVLFNRHFNHQVVFIVKLYLFFLLLVRCIPLASANYAEQVAKDELSRPIVEMLCGTPLKEECEEVKKRCTVKELEQSCIENTLYQIMMDVEMCTNEADFEKCLADMESYRQKFTHFIQNTLPKNRQIGLKAIMSCQGYENTKPTNDITKEVAQLIESISPHRTDHLDYRKYFRCIEGRYEELIQ
jgi:hypothetical protein